MRIAICDDEKSQLVLLGNFVKEWAKENGKICEIDFFENAESFWLKYSKDRYDIALLDIQMGFQNGMELARELRAKNDKTQIIFVTAIDDFIGDGYDVNAVHYLLKPIKKEKLFDALSRAESNASSNEKQKVLIEFNGETHVFFENSVMYLEAFSHTTLIYTDGGEIEVPMGISAVFEKFSKDCLVKIHRSYAVNIDFVKQIRKYEITLDNGKILPVSRRMFNDVSREFINHYKKEVNPL